MGNALSSGVLMSNLRDLSRAEALLREEMPRHVREDDGYYQDRIWREAVLESYEWDILNYLGENFDPSTVRIVEAGAGWGMLCILLAVLGFEVVAFNGEAMYAKTMRSLTARLALPFPSVKKRLTIAEGFFPYALGNEHLSSRTTNVLVSTNVIHEFNRTSQDAFLAAATRFDQVIIDVATFARDRNDAEQKALKVFLAQGFDTERSLWADRLLVLKPKQSSGWRKAARPQTPAWLLGRPAPLGKHGAELGQSADAPISFKRLASDLLRHIGFRRSPMAVLRYVQGREPFTPVAGHCWMVELPLNLLPLSDSSEFPVRSPWRLLEDGSLLGPPHAQHADISKFGGGRYSHWNSYFFFSTSDNSSPNSNGRRYTLVEAVIGGEAGPESLSGTIVTEQSNNAAAHIGRARPQRS